MEITGQTTRRKFLTSTSIGAVGLTGCLTENEEEAIGTTTRFDFGGVIIRTRPTAEKIQPIDASVTIEKEGEKKYDRSHTIEDQIDGIVTTVEEDWMKSRVPYTITVSTPEHDKRVLSTTEFDNETDKYVDKLVYFEFWVHGITISIHPVDVEEPLNPAD